MSTTTTRTAALLQLHYYAIGVKGGQEALHADYCAYDEGYNEDLYRSTALFEFASTVRDLTTSVTEGTLPYKELVSYLRITKGRHNNRSIAVLAGPMLEIIEPGDEARLAAVKRAKAARKAAKAASTARLVYSNPMHGWGVEVDEAVLLNDLGVMCVRQIQILAKRPGNYTANDDNLLGAYVKDLEGAVRADDLIGATRTLKAMAISTTKVVRDFAEVARKAYSLPKDHQGDLLANLEAMNDAYVAQSQEEANKYW
jgi:hypothetical protein